MKKHYRADIDGLRAVAVILVVAFHAFPNLVRGGFVGVDVFYVISGYLITGIIRSDLNTDKFSIAGFYNRRARRILPALAVVLVSTLALGWAALLPVPYASLGLQAFAGALFFPNLIFWNEVGYFDAAAETKPLLHLWSLGVEEQFYLVWPLLLLLLSRRPKWLIPALSLIVAASLTYSCYATLHSPAAAFYSPLSRLWELGIGGILTFVCLRVKWQALTSSIGLALIVCAALALDSDSAFPGPLALVPTIGTAIIIVTGSDLLGRRLPASLGLVSYPLYLWHWPLLSFAASEGITSGAGRLAIVGASLCLALLTTALIERPIRFGRMRQSGVYLSCASICLIAMCSGIIWRSGGLLWRYSKEIRPVLATMQYDPRADARVMKCWLDVRSPFEAYSAECGAGATLIWGDSHAGRLYAGFAKDGVLTAQFTRDGCLPTIGFAVEACDRSNIAILRTIARLKPRRVILFGSWTDQSDHLIDVQHGVATALVKLNEVVGDVVVVGPAPVWSPSLPVQVYQFWGQTGYLPDRLVPTAKDYHKIDNALEATAVAAHVRFISLIDALCDDSGCLTHTPKSKSELLTWDYGHLTTEGARFVTSLLRLD